MSPARPGDAQEEPFCPCTQAQTGEPTDVHCVQTARPAPRHPPPEVSGTLRLARRGPERTRGDVGSRWGRGHRGALQESGLKWGSGPSPAVHDDYAPCPNSSLTCEESESC